jgi:hypothetical protein
MDMIWGYGYEGWVMGYGDVSLEGLGNCAAMW